MSTVTHRSKVTPWLWGGGLTQAYLEPGGLLHSRGAFTQPGGSYTAGGLLHSQGGSYTARGGHMTEDTIV